eukprot:gene10121-11203_t
MKRVYSEISNPPGDPQSVASSATHSKRVPGQGNAILALARTIPMPSLASSRPAIRTSHSAPSPPPEDLRFIHGNVVNMKALLANAPQARDAVAKPPETSKRAILDEVDALLSKRSSHAREAEDEWFAAHQQRLAKLDQQEKRSQQMAKQTEEIFIKAYVCVSCSKPSSSVFSRDHLRDAFPELCQEKGHEIHSMRAVKRFFLCQNCNRRDYVLDLASSNKKQQQQQPQVEDSARTTTFCAPPSHRCHCGALAWRRCGQRGLGLLDVSARDTQLTNLLGLPLVSAATDWMKGQDKVAMAVRVSNLTATKSASVSTSSVP